jgi:hypothetical protein
VSQINRALNEEERDLLSQLAIRVLAEQTSGDNDEARLDAARTELQHLAAEGKVSLRGDLKEVYLELDGKALVHAERDWLAFHASFPGNDPLKDGHWGNG